MVVRFVIYLLAHVYTSSCTPFNCDSSKDIVHEGNNGETSALSWLGILRVNLYEGKSLKIALTGIVLVKEGYAIANADDIIKIPKTYLTEKSKAMFIPKPEAPWYCTVKDYMTHPEYQYTTMNTLALLELEDTVHNYFPMRPICWPPFTQDITTDLYAFGFTDENQLLEKSVYKMQHVDLNVCKDFYNRAGFTEGMQTPNSFVCGFATNNTRDCVWDNGMVLASNSTGYWKLLGFGMQGPGCSAPARFLNMLSYFQWIDTSTDQYDVDYGDFRRSGLVGGFNKNKTPRIQDVPIHNLFAMNEVQSRRVWCPQEKKLYEHGTYPFDTEQYQDRFYSIERINKDNIVIWAENVTTPYTHGNCSEKYKLVYRENTLLKNNGFFGKAIYKLSVMDLNELEFTCIDIKIIPGKINAIATIYYGVEIDNTEGMSGIEEMPPGLLKNFILRPSTTAKPGRGEWNPGAHLKIKYIQDTQYFIKQPNINILLRFDYKNEALYKVAILSARSVTTEKPLTTTKNYFNKVKKGRKKPQYLKEGRASSNDTVTISDNSTDFDETFKSDLKKYIGVEVKEVDRYMKEVTSSCSRTTAIADVAVSFTYFLLVIHFRVINAY